MRLCKEFFYFAGILSGITLRQEAESFDMPIGVIVMEIK